MNILIDVDALQAEGVLTAELAARLRASAIRTTASAALNGLIAFGAFAVAIGLCVLSGSVAFAAAVGLAFYIAGAFVVRLPAFAKLGGVAMVIGALTTAGATAFLIGKPLEGAALAAVILFGAGVHARSRLLLALAPLAIAATIGGGAGYWDACYMIMVSEPTLTILLFSALALAGLVASQRLPVTEAPLALAFARMSLVLVNFGFWVGSLWGDRPGDLWRAPAARGTEPLIPALAFVVAWIACLLLVGAWGARSGRRFLVNIAIVFGAIEFYTQVFERWGDNPLSLVMAGGLTVAIGLILWSYNREPLVNR